MSAGIIPLLTIEQREDAKRKYARRKAIRAEMATIRAARSQMRARLIALHRELREIPTVLEQEKRLGLARNSLYTVMTHKYKKLNPLDAKADDVRA